MDTHIKVISVIDIILGVLTILGGVALLFAGLGGTASLGTTSATAAATLAAVGVFGGLFAIAVGILGVVVGIKLNEYKNWARIAQIIFGIVELINFPLGTAFGIYSLWAMYSEEGRALFQRRPEEKMRRAA